METAITVVGVVIAAIIATVVTVLVRKSMKGRIAIHLGRGGYDGGEEVEGTLSVALKKELETRRLFVALVADERVERVERDDDGDERRDTESHEIFRREVDLIEQATVLPAGHEATYSFSIPSPPRVQGRHEGMTLDLGPISLRGGPRSWIEWRVEARLDTPGLDLTASHHVRIDVA